MKRIISVLLLLVTFYGLTACGGGSGGGSSDEAQESENSITQATGSQFPQVAGTYGIVTESFQISCDNGEQSTSLKSAINITISQNNNELTADVIRRDSTPGVTILETSRAKGLIDIDGTFTLTEVVKTAINGISGTQIIKSAWTGSIINGDISGDYNGDISYTDLDSSCNTTTQFSGENVNSINIPAVSGIYAFSTNRVSYSCTDGSTGTSNPVAFNVNVSQNHNELTLTRTNPDFNIPGIDVIESNGMVGLVDETGSFILTETLLARVDGVPGQQTVHYLIEGDFGSGDWFGNYEFSLISISLGGVCNYSSLFDGLKILALTPAPAPTPTPTPTIDTDGDGISDELDNDDDNDGVNDSLDSSPLDPNKTSDWEVFQVTDNDISDFFPSIYNGTIAWKVSEHGNENIYYWNGDSTNRISSHDQGGGVSAPSLYDGTIAWGAMDMGWREHGILYDQIYYWDGSNTIQVTEPVTEQSDPASSCSVRKRHIAAVEAMEKVGSSAHTFHTLETLMDLEKVSTELLPVRDFGLCS